MIARVLTPWIVNDGENWPKVFLDYKNHHPFVCEDRTGQPTANIVPSPNLFEVEVVCDAATLAAIEADPQYYVLWSEE